MATPEQISQRNRSAQSEILSQLVAETGRINTAAGETVNRLLNEKFGRRSALTQRRINRQARITQLNTEYVQRTQQVLNQKTLDFLVRNSQIDAPTLTSIFAGFELARASAADRLERERELGVDAIIRQDALDAQSVSDFEQRVDAQLATVESRRLEDVNQVVRIGDTIGVAVGRDIASLERAEAATTAADRQDARQARVNRSREAVARIRAQTGGRSRTQSSNLAFILNNTPEETGALSPDEFDNLPIDQPLLEEEPQSDPEPPIVQDQQVTVQQDPEREAFAGVINTVLESPGDADALSELNRLIEDRELTPQERRLTSTLQARSVIDQVLQDEPEDEQALQAESELRELSRLQFESVFPPETQQEINANARLNDQTIEADRINEAERLNTALVVVNQVLSNDNATIAQREAADAARIELEERLNELGDL